MVAPVIQNGPWTFSVNRVVRASDKILTAEGRREVIYQLKEALVSFAAWSVVASSNAISVKNVGDASPDLWDSYIDVVSAPVTNPHGWIVLENSTTGEQLCIDMGMGGTGAYNLTLIYSATGSFSTDGTTGDRPTAAESQLGIQNRSVWIHTVVNGAVVHAMISADNKITRWYIHQRNGASSGGWFVGLEELKDPPAVWTSTHKRCLVSPNVHTTISTAPIGKSPRSWIHLGSGYSPHCYLADTTPSAGWDSVRLTTPCMGYGSNTDSLFEHTNTLDWGGGYAAGVLGVFNPAVERGGGLGTIQDMYFAPTRHDTYNMYDGVNNKEWIKFGCFMVPWNGTNPVEV